MEPPPTRNCFPLLHARHFRDHKWVELPEMTPIPPLEAKEKHLDLDEPRFALQGADKITYTDSYKQVIGDDDPESIMKGEGKGKGGDSRRQGDN